MSEAAYHWGLFLVLPAALLLVAGLGWRKLARGLVLSFLIALAGGVALGLLGGAVESPLDRGGGAWRGLGTLGVAILGFVGGFAACLTGAILWQVRRKRLSLEREGKSPPVLAAAGVCVAIAVFCLVEVSALSTPSSVSTELLVRRVAELKAYRDTNEEIVRRGGESVPFLVAELHRFPYAQKDDHAAGGMVHVPPLLDLLGRIGGPDAVAELRRWADAESWETARAAALAGLAQNGEPGAARRIGEMLDKIKPTYGPSYRVAPLLRVLGRQKAAAEAGVIQRFLKKALTRRNFFSSPGNERRQLKLLAGEDRLTIDNDLHDGVCALAEIDVPESWAALADLLSQSEPRHRALLALLLENCPGDGAVKLLAKALADPDAMVRECAYLALWHRDASLQKSYPEKWGEADGKRLGEALEKRGGRG